MGKISASWPHIAVCPSAGIGHLIPFLRLASMLSSSNCKVTLITIQPTLSAAEANQISTFLSTHPHINSLDISLHSEPPPDLGHGQNVGTTTTRKGGPDPFFLRYDAVSRSAHLLIHNISSLSPPPSAVIYDIMLVSGLSQALAELNIPNYVLVATSARFFSLTAYLAILAKLNDEDSLEKLDLNENDQVVDFPPGLPPVAKSSIPPPFFNPNHIFTKMLASNSSNLHKANGIIFNSFDFLEPETISALEHRNALSNLPPVFPIGPLKALAYQKQGSYPSWLDEQPHKSVLYISFGSRTAMSREQIHELRDGLEKSDVRFLWVIKTTTIDKDESEDTENLLGPDFLQRNKGRGLVMKEWVNQESILDHPSIGGFMTHCGWNSVLEVAQRGVRVLAWPQHGDQKVNAEVVAKSGLGVWEKEWGWVGQRLVKCDEIAEKIKDVMASEELRLTAIKVGEEASKAWDTTECSNGGSSSCAFTRLIIHITDSTKKQ